MNYEINTLQDLQNLGVTTLIITAIKVEHERNGSLMEHEKTNERLIKIFDAVNEKLPSGARISRCDKDDIYFLKEALGSDNYQAIIDANNGYYLVSIPLKF